MNQNLSEKKTVCVIGAGLTGLVAAYRLAVQGHVVHVLESSLAAGGMVTTFPLGKGRIEHIYHHIFTSDHDLIELCSELGIDNPITYHETRDALYASAQLYPFSGPIDLLRFRPLPLIQRIKTGLCVLKARRVKHYQDFEKESAADYLYRTNGPDAYEKLWKPLLRAKFDEDADQVSAVWIWNKFKLRGGSRSGRLGRQQLGYMRGSFQTLVDALVKAIESSGGQIHFGYTAMDIVENNRRIQVTCILDNRKQASFSADAVIAAVSSRQFANITTNLSLPEQYLRRIRQVRYKADLCLVLRTVKSLSSYYWTTVCDDLPFVVVIEHTNMTGTAEYGGSVIYLSRYLDVSDPLWIRSDGEIFHLFTAGLKTMYPQFDISDVLDWRLKRTRYAQPVIPCDYKSKQPDMQTPVAGVYLAGMAQIYPEDRGMNYAVRLAREVAESADNYLLRTDPTVIP
jgi:protoporphyrinogen oxidase